jgi:hypothetical protein
MPGRSHFNLFNKDTRDLFMLCIVFMCQLYRVLFIIVARVYYCCSFILFIVRLSFVLMSDFCYFSILLLFIYSLFIVQKKKIQFWSWIVFQVFWSRCTRTCCTLVQELPSSSMQVNKYHTSDCTDFVLVEKRVAYYDHKHSGIDKTNILQVVKAVEGKTPTPLNFYQLVTVNV